MKLSFNVLAIFLAVVVGCASVAGAGDERPIVAVFNVELRNIRFSRSEREALSEYLTGKIAETGVYQVVSRDQLKKQLRRKKVKIKKDVWCDQSCQFDIGKELSAEKMLSTKVIKLGSMCTVSVTLYDLGKATADSAASASGKCKMEDIVASMNKAVDELTGASKRAAEELAKKAEEERERLARGEAERKAAEEKARRELRTLSQDDIEIIRKKQKTNRLTVYPGEGVNGIIVGVSTVYDVLETYGRDCVVSTHNAEDDYNHRYTTCDGPLPQGIVRIEYEWLENGIEEEQFDRKRSKERPEQFEISNGIVKEIQIGCYQDYLHTPEGINNESTKDQVLRAYGDTFRYKDYETAESCIYGGIGLQISFHKKLNRVTSINVIEPE